MSDNILIAFFTTKSNCSTIDAWNSSGSYVFFSYFFIENLVKVFVVIDFDKTCVILFSKSSTPVFLGTPYLSIMHDSIQKTMKWMVSSERSLMKFMRNWMYST